MPKLIGKVAVVTGASKGIGAGIAKALAEAGASVVVNYASSKQDAQNVVAAIKAKGGKAIAVQGSTAVAADVKRIFAETKKAFNGLDVLVNNAGVFKFDALEAVTEEEFHRQYNTNVLGPLLVTQEALNHFSDKGGSVINISSVVSTSPMPTASVYAGTKGALDSITQVLAQELGPRKIRVNAINPGGIDTEGTRTLGIIGSDFENMMVARTPLGRMGQPDDIARVAVFLASDDAGWITGERIRAGGGFA